MRKINLKIVALFALLALQLACEQIRSTSIESEQIKIENKLINENSNFEVVVNDKEETDYFAHLKPEYKEILKEWLKFKPFLRPAIEEIDSSLDGDDLKDVHQKGWTQFYTVADINKDGKKDFAVLLIDTRQKDKFALAIFNGSQSKGKTPDYFEEDYNGISKVVISYENKRDDYFSSSSYLLLYDRKRSACMGYIPNKNTYKAYVCI